MFTHRQVDGIAEMLLTISNTPEESAADSAESCRTHLEMTFFSSPKEKHLSNTSW